MSIQEGKPERYVFQAVVVETSTQQAASLQEKFFSLKTKEWTVAKILSLAKLHVMIVQELKTIFLANLHNIHNKITHNVITLM